MVCWTYINTDACLWEDARVGQLFGHEAEELLGAVIPLNGVERLAHVQRPAAAERGAGADAYRLGHTQLDVTQT